MVLFIYAGDGLFTLNFKGSCTLGVAIMLAATSCRAETGTCGDDPGKVQIRLTKLADVVQARFHFAKAVQCIEIGQGTRGAAEWKLQADAAVVARDDRIVRLDKPTTDFVLNLTPVLQDGQLDRTYTPLIPFGDGSASAVYADAIMPPYWKAKTEVRYAGYLPTAAGGVIGEQVYSGTSEPTYLVVGGPELSTSSQVHVITDRALPPKLRARVLRELGNASRNVAGVYPAPMNLTYLITYSAPAADGAAWRGDTLPGLVRLNFMGKLWGSGDIDMNDVAHFVHHETFHTVNWKADTTQPATLPTLLLEGGADAAAAYMTLGPSGDILRKRADSALRDCANIPGKRLADKAATNPRWTPYRCGEAVQYMASVASGSRFNVLPIWSRLLRKAAGRPYGWSDFVDAMHVDHAAHDERADDLIKQLVAGTLEWNDALPRFEKIGVLAQLDNDALHSQQISQTYAQKSLSTLLDTHCVGRRGTLYLNQKYILDAPSDSCKEVPDKFPVTKIENFDLEVRGYEAYQLVSERCRSGGRVTLGADDGKTFSLSCKASVQPLVFYRFRPDAG